MNQSMTLSRELLITDNKRRFLLVYKALYHWLSNMSSQVTVLQPGGPLCPSPNTWSAPAPGLVSSRQLRLENFSLVFFPPPCRFCLPLTSFGEVILRHLLPLFFFPLVIEFTNCRVFCWYICIGINIGIYWYICLIIYCLLLPLECMALYSSFQIMLSSLQRLSKYPRNK